MRRLGILLAAIAASIAAVALAGCGSTPDEELSLKRIHLAVPLHGPLGQRGHDMADAAKLALKLTNHNTTEAQLELEVHDISVPTGNRYRNGEPLAVKESLRKAQDAAVEATEDPDALALIGGLDEETIRVQSMLTIPVGLLQLSLARQLRTSERWVSKPSSPPTNIVRLIPAPSLQADAVAQAKLREPGGKFVEDTPALVNTAKREALITPALHEESLQSGGRRFYENFRNAYDRTPDRWAIYTYDAVTLAVEAIERAGKSSLTRRAVSGAALTVQNRYGAIGHYDVLPNGFSTLHLFQERRIPLRPEVPEEPGGVFEALADGAAAAG